MKIMYDILCPKDGILEDLLNEKCLTPYSDVVINFLTDISKILLSSPEYKKYPDVVTLGFWLRKAHLMEMKSTYFVVNDRSLRLARGLVFHITPSNIETMFAYSLFVSLLMGNKNIVRISSRDSRTISILLEEFSKLLNTDKYKMLKKYIAIIRYDHDDSVTQYFSSLCDVRVIWGGNETINKIRSIPVNPHACEIVFPDRFSYAVINSAAFIKKEDKKELVRRSYTDIFSFDQNACSSLKLFVWVGNNKENTRARQLFWSLFTDLIKEVNPEFSQDYAIKKLNSSYLASAGSESGTSIEKTASNVFNRLFFTSLKDINRDLHCGRGLIFECSVKKLESLSGFIRTRDQTMAVLGFDKDDIARLLENSPASGIYRVVPLGKTLDFSVLWDGYNLFSELTREVNIDI
jgi:hypothetical protein